MDRVQKIIDHAEQYCTAYGSHLTSRRKQVLSGLLQSEKAMSAYELTDFCKARLGEPIPVMTVYRILNFLQDEHRVHKLNSANKYVACAHITSDHAHAVQQFLICGQCQKVNEIRIDKSIIAELRKNVEHAGFHLASPQREMNCICDTCIADAA